MTKDQSGSPELTSAERQTEERDGQITKAVRQLNQGTHVPVKELFPGAIQAGELEYWSCLGNVAKVKLALQKGADVNAKGESDYTALHGAAENGHAEIVELLLAHGANKNAKVSSGKTPLDFARAGKHEVVVRLLERK